MSTPVGIDLGTTHSIVSALQEGVPVPLPDPTGALLVPSVVAVDDAGHVLVGAAARELAVRRPAQAAARFKTDMGTERAYTLGPLSFRPVELSALVLRELKAQAEAALGHALDEVVVSVPAWFHEPQRRDTVEAARLAGLSVKHLVNEPTAAALAHGLHQRDAELTVAVLDLGGGTFDVTILELFEGMVEVKASVGDARLGGEDVTDAVEGWLVQVGQLDRAVRDPERRGILRHLAEQAKRRLTADTEARVDLSVLGGPADLHLDRLGLEQLTAPLLARVRGCVREALAQARMLPGAIDEVLLVGGATRMPAVHALARDLFHAVPREGVDPDLIVAAGAAVQAGLRAKDATVRDLVVTDVLTHSLGTSVVREWDGVSFRGRFSPILHRGTTLPASRVERFQPLTHDQHQMNVDVYEGEHREVQHNTRLGVLELHDLPVHADPEQRTQVDVRFTHDASGLLEVEATVVDTGHVARTALVRAGPQRSEAELERALQALAGLKTHPRDLLPNRLALERAARVLTMLPGRDRVALDQALLALEAALELQEPALVGPRREVLVTLTTRLVQRYELDAP